jgi:hypothetical protein
MNGSPMEEGRGSYRDCSKRVRKVRGVCLQRCVSEGTEFVTGKRGRCCAVGRIPLVGAAVIRMPRRCHLGCEVGVGSIGQQRVGADLLRKQRAASVEP